VTPPLPMDRRNVLKLGGAAAIAALAPGIRCAPTACAGSATSMIALADPRYGDSLMFAESLQRQGAMPVILASDRARLWFDAIEPRTRDCISYLAGLTLESDLFVFERLAASSAAPICYVGFHDWRCRQGAAHTLSGSIALDPIAAALVKGEDRWAEGLGQALVLAKDEGHEERRLHLDYAMAACPGPRFLVSWLMRWTG
jgi:hypothetical protein